MVAFCTCFTSASGSSLQGLQDDDKGIFKCLSSVSGLLASDPSAAHLLKAHASTTLSSELDQSLIGGKSNFLLAPSSSPSTKVKVSFRLVITIMHLASLPEGRPAEHEVVQIYDELYQYLVSTVIRILVSRASILRRILSARAYADAVTTLDHNISLLREELRRVEQAFTHGEYFPPKPPSWVLNALLIAASVRYDTVRGAFHDAMTTFRFDKHLSSSSSHANTIEYLDLVCNALEICETHKAPSDECSLSVFDLLRFVSHHMEGFEATAEVSPLFGLINDAHMWYFRAGVTANRTAPVSSALLRSALSAFRPDPNGATPPFDANVYSMIADTDKVLRLDKGRLQLSIQSLAADLSERSDVLSGELLAWEETSARAMAPLTEALLIYSESMTRQALSDTAVSVSSAEDLVLENIFKDIDGATTPVRTPPGSPLPPAAAATEVKGETAVKGPAPDTADSSKAFDLSVSGDGSSPTDVTAAAGSAAGGEETPAEAKEEAKAKASEDKAPSSVDDASTSKDGDDPSPAEGEPTGQEDRDGDEDDAGPRVGGDPLTILAADFSELKRMHHRSNALNFSTITSMADVLSDRVR